MWKRTNERGMWSSDLTTASNDLIAQTSGNAAGPRHSISTLIHNNMYSNCMYSFQILLNMIMRRVFPSILIPMKFHFFNRAGPPGTLLAAGIPFERWFLKICIHFLSYSTLFLLLSNLIGYDRGASFTFDFMDQMEYHLC